MKTRGCIALGFAIFVSALTALPLFAGGGAQSGGGTSAGGGKTVVTVWTQNRHDAEFMQKKVNEYNASNQDNIEVRYEIYSDNYEQVVNMVFQSGEAPDIFNYQGGIFQSHVNAGVYADLTPFMDEDFKKTFSAFLYDGVNVIDGKCYYIPTGATSYRLFYNKDIFRRVGISGPPKTLEELVAGAKLITNTLKGEGIYGFASNMKNPTSALARSLDPMAQRETGLSLGFDFTKGEYDFTPYEKILLAFRELLSPAVAFPGCESLDIDPLRTQFAAGKIGMYFSYTHAEPGVYASQFPMRQEEWGCAQIPVSGGNPKGLQAFSPLNGYLLNAKSKNLPAAWKVFEDLLGNITVLSDYFDSGFGIPLIPEATAKLRQKPPYQNNPDLLVTSSEGILPKTPYNINPEAVVVEGLNDYNTYAQIIAGTLDVKQGLADLTVRYNRAYRAGISQGTGKEVKLPSYNPLKP
jgi:multiple sugar transport system substrate-binding protein